MTNLSQKAPLTPEQRRERDRERAEDAARAMQEYREAERAFYANRDRLRAERLAREVQAKH